MDLTPPRGTQDLLPSEAGRMLGLYGLAVTCARLYGYRYIETPAFEYVDLFRRTAGETSDVVQKEMYTFEDRRGRLLALRPEVTAPIVRAYLQRRHGLPSPFKVFTIGRMWRYGRPQSGRLREFRQFNVEAIGERESAADVEVIALGDAFLRETGIGDFELQINSIGDENCRPGYRLELLEFLRANRDRIRDEHKYRFEENPLRVLDCKDESCRALAAEAPKIVDRLCSDCRKHFDNVQEGLAAESINVSLNPTLVRGLDYYTRTTFEWVSVDLAPSQNSVGGGGRYDGLAEVLGGPPTPGVGFAIGLDRIGLLLTKGNQPPMESPDRPDVYVIGLGHAWKRAREVLHRLRQAGISALGSLEPPSFRIELRSQLRAAGKSHARYAVIIGEEEASEDTLTVKRLKDQQQRSGLSFDEVASWIKEDAGG